jgi:hypothetical protein
MTYFKIILGELGERMGHGPIWSTILRICMHVCACEVENLHIKIYNLDKNNKVEKAHCMQVPSSLFLSTRSNTVDFFRKN